MKQRRRMDNGTWVAPNAVEGVAASFNQDRDLPQPEELGTPERQDDAHPDPMQYPDKHFCACGAGCPVDRVLGMPQCTYQELGGTLKFIEDVVEG